MAVLYPGSWKAFNEWTDEGVFIPEDLSEKIFLLLREEQLREIGDEVKDRYIMGFGKEKPGPVRGMMGDIFEQEEPNVHKSNCHPGRFSLNPDAGVRAVLGNPALLCGGYAPRRLSSRKHRKLTPDIVKWRCAQNWPGEGYQDIYFLGGLPLQYWSFGDGMGLRLPDKDMAEKTEWLSGNWMWRGKEDESRYQLTDGLLAFGEYGGAHAKNIDIWIYTRYLQRQEQAMIDGKYRFT